MLTRFQFHCSITCRDILYFVFWLPYCHTLWCHQYLICIIQKSWISLERDEIWQKGKHHSSSLLKAFQIRLFFNTSIFHFILSSRSNDCNWLASLLRSRSGRSHVTLSVPTRLLQTDIHSFLGVLRFCLLGPMSLSFSCHCICCRSICSLGQFVPT